MPSKYAAGVIAFALSLRICFFSGSQEGAVGVPIRENTQSARCCETLGRLCETPFHIPLSWTSSTRCARQLFPDASLSILCRRRFSIQELHFGDYCSTQRKYSTYSPAASLVTLPATRAFAVLAAREGVDRIAAITGSLVQPYQLHVRPYAWICRTCTSYSSMYDPVVEHGQHMAA